MSKATLVVISTFSVLVMFFCQPAIAVQRIVLAEVFEGTW